MNNKKILSVNLITSMITLIVNVGINLLVMPYIVNKAGSEVYGFVSLANNIVNYATIITVALNSVSARFIAISIHQGKNEEANEYFNSVFWADLIMCIVILALGTMFTINIQYFLNIPNELINQVRQLFIWLICNLILSVIGTIFTVATYITNKLYLSSIVNTIAILLKAGILLLLFGFLPINIAYVGIATTAYSSVILIFNGIFTRRLVPDLRLSLKCFSKKSTKEMMESGIWSSITKLSSTLSDGMDTIITNLYLSGSELGALTIAYTIPSLAGTLLASICSLFNPQLTYHYANGNSDQIIKEIKTNMKLTGFFSCILFCGIVVFGIEFFSLIVPNENILLIYQLACLSCISMVVSGITSGLTNIFLLTNKLKINSIVWLIISFFDIILVLILVNTTSLGVYVVVGVSKIVGTIVNLTYLPIYACHCLKINKMTFYPLIIRYIGVIAINLGIFLGIRSLLQAEYSWVHFCIQVIVCVILGGMINLILLLDKNERRYIIKK